MKNLLFRIRAETLRVNLEQAHASLRNLPNLYGELQNVRQHLDEIAQQAFDISDHISSWKNDVKRKHLPDIPSMVQREGELTDLAGDLQNTAAQLEAMENKSFLVQARSIGENVWQHLNDRARALRSSVREIEQGPGDAASWAALTKAAEAAEICELADAIVRLINRTSTDALHAIPGGIASMMMTLERIVRLRFPEWTIWALPFVAHEVWRLAVRRQLQHDLKDKFDAAGKPAMLDDERMLLCLADGFATYTMGPAYAYAAITMLFDPALPENEYRVGTILKMLDRMNPGEGSGAPGGGMAESYQTVIDELRNAWDEAKMPAGLAEIGITNADDLDILVRLLREVLLRKFEEFGLDQWLSLDEWRDRLINPQTDFSELLKTVDLQSIDLRHALNAAWGARVCPTREPDQDITERAMELMKEVKDQVSTTSIPTAGFPLGLNRAAGS